MNEDGSTSTQRTKIWPKKKISNDRMKLNRSRKKGGQNLNNTFCNNNNNNKHG